MTFLNRGECPMGNRSEEKERCGCRSLCGGIQVPTDAERVALNAMRSIRDQARALREKMARFETGGSAEEESERVRMRQEIDRLRREWQEWEKKRERASKERMILLGHEEPDNN
jgi:hypothetical protein